MFTQLRIARPIVGSICRLRPAQVVRIAQPLFANTSRAALTRLPPAYSQAQARMAMSTQTARSIENDILLDKIKAELHHSEAIILEVRADLQALAKSNPEVHRRLKDSVQRSWVTDALLLGFLFEN